MEASKDLGAAQMPLFQEEMGAALATVHRVGPDGSSYMRHQFAKRRAEFRTLGGDDRLHDTVARRDRARRGAVRQLPGRCPLLQRPPRGQRARRPEGHLGGAPRDRRGLIDPAKADCCSLDHGNPERDDLFEGYGPLPADAADPITPSNWNWFHSIGTLGPLDDIAHLAGRRSGTPSRPWPGQNAGQPTRAPDEGPIRPGRPEDSHYSGWIGWAGCTACEQE
ncbi:hypothetical protein OHV13_03425 [Kitasatospora purpeofusca]|uniref:hypothetical protein n=1 Tax=Kitasatospora purpeofusca TaxID=67352 RepID=UPI00324DB955